MWATPVTLRGEHASLVPLDMVHADDLAAASADGELHRLWYTWIPAPDQVGEEITRRLSLQEDGSMVPFAVLDASGRAVGMTTFMNIDHSAKRMEIGSTWYARSAQRGPLNTECKLMLLRHAFETLDAIAVEFRTHALNHQSRRAIERLGAKLDGVLRSHMVMANGTLRDTAVYSIIAGEWPAVRANLMWQMEKPRS
ncbi:Putative ribosomal N-acetyltransferase YdaF [Falsiruegeria litorea R37]|uniref:Putative ribosomal N-acetyltransferase YdaF n=1 Tax=Falsiruegeria litorea R37 TaxID=1200284 RepID=A0A1Y5RRE0_9RHOB|nr:GNAT family protein [Falsiruegeria litorea]SLN20911.1 Putative ribosomal N-acetyltransferase YdaF [Falsiruegeria litorea R37]